MSAVADLKEGSEFAGCRLGTVAGEGGMAIVYRATQLGLDRPVAVKVMAARYASDPKFRERFARESQIASQIDHPNVIPVHEAGEDRGRLFIVMKLVDGDNLQDVVLSSGRLDPDLAVDVITHVAAALDVAHAAGLVHRDIKPANVLLEASTGHVYLTDFGLARNISDPSFTESSHVMATARYAAPERLREGDHGTIRGDVYSLGCMLWDLVAGVDRPEPKTVPGVPPALDSVIWKGVASDPQARYTSAGALAEAARRALEAQPARPNVPASPFRSLRRPGPFPEAISAGLSERVRQLCDAVLAQVADEDLRRAIEGVRRQLDEPLRVAVAGDVSSGKSTLVNALLRRRIAQTGVGETTRAVSWYRHGTPERIEVRLRSGERIERGLSRDGSLPEELAASLGVAAEEISEIDVWLQSDELKSLTIIDTPGLATLNEDVAGRAMAVVAPPEERDGQAADNDRAIREAQALVFTMAGDARARDQEALRAFHDRYSGSARASAVNAIGVLTKADKVDAGHDPLARASEKAERMREALGPLVSTVLPLIGLLAETADAGALSEEHVAPLQALAAAAEEEPILRSAKAFLDAEVGVTVAQREELLDLLGLVGLERAFELARAEQLTGVELVRRMRETSGIASLRKHLGGLGLRGDALKADTALTQLDDLSWTDRRVAFLRGAVQRTRLEPAMHVLELFRALDRCADERVALPADKLAELERMITARSVAARLGLGDDAPTAELLATAAERHTSWKVFSARPSTTSATQGVARPVIQAYEILLEQAREAERGAA